MDYFSSQFQTLLFPIFVVVITLVYASFKLLNKPSHYYSSSTNNNKTKNDIPEPPGWLPIIGHLHLLGGRDPVARTLGAMADRHGPIFALRLGRQRAIVVSGPEPIKECLTAANDRLFADRPPIAISKYVGYGGASFALSPYGQYWRDLRKLATLNLLSGRSLQALGPARVAEIDSFVRGLNREPQKPLDLGEHLERATFDINARLIVGKRCHAASAEMARRFWEAVKEALYLSGVFVWSDTVPWLEGLDIHGHVAAMKRVFREFDFVLGKWLDQHRGGGGDDVAAEERDLMDVMLESIEEDDAMLAGYTRDTVVKATALILMLTGTESTSVTLTWAISLLLNNPNVLKSAQEELDTHVGRDRWAQESDLNNLQLLQAILKETLRLYPPGPIAGPRVATEDCHVAGHFVPKGTRLIVNIWKVHRDPRVWADPEEFRPERFLADPAGPARDSGFGYIPFGSGRRSCPGMGLGLLVVQLILARLVQGFDMRTEDGKPVDMSEGLGIALPKLSPLKVLLSPRLPKHLYV